MYNLVVWPNWNFLHIFPWITLPIQSCLTLYSFWANLLHSLIMWLIVSSLSLHSLHLLFCCVLSILTLIWLVLMALSCAAIRRDSVSLLRGAMVLKEYALFPKVPTLLEPYHQITLCLIQDTPFGVFYSPHSGDWASYNQGIYHSLNMKVFTSALFKTSNESFNFWME